MSGIGSGPCSFGPKQGIIDWFGNPGRGLDLPFPEPMAYLAAWSEYFGAILLPAGHGVGPLSLPLRFTVIVAAASGHWQNGGLAIAEDGGPSPSKGPRLPWNDWRQPAPSCRCAATTAG